MKPLFRLHRVSPYQGRIKHWYRRWKCRRDFDRLDLVWQWYFREIHADPESLIERFLI